MRSILLAHAEKYPLMEPTDAVKLLYQSEFGGGHLIRDEQACLNFLHQEYHATMQDRSIPLAEEIGNGFVRINLAALNHSGLSIEELGDAFFRSAAQHHGNMESFREKLSLLTGLTQNGRMPFSAEALQNYLTGYEAAGFPPVSHSEAYRRAYHPAYRVISRPFLPHGFNAEK